VRAGDKRRSTLLQVAPNQLLQMPPLHTVLRGGKRSGTKNVPSRWLPRCTEIGTLELYCVAKDEQNRWRLEFSVRDIIQDTDEDGKKAEATVTDVWPEAPVQEAAKVIRETYAAASGRLTEATDESDGSRAGPRAARNGQRDCADACGTSSLKSQIAASYRQHISPAGTISSASVCVPASATHGTSSASSTLELLHASPKGAKPGLVSPRGGADYWIMWRRVAGGLPTALQNTLFTRMRPVLLPGRSKASKACGKRIHRDVASRRQSGAHRSQLERASSAKRH